MSYIAKAFIITLDTELLNKIRLQLIELGYKSFYSGGRTQLAINKGLYALNAPDIDGFIDCNFYANGDEDLAVKLFLELAEMDSDNTNTLWYFAETLTTNKDGRDVRSDIVYFKGLSLYAKCNTTTQPLTPLKLAEAVLDGKINL